MRVYLGNEYFFFYLFLKFKIQIKILVEFFKKNLRGGISSDSPHFPLAGGGGGGGGDDIPVILQTRQGELPAAFPVPLLFMS